MSSLRDPGHSTGPPAEGGLPILNTHWVGYATLRPKICCHITRGWGRPHVTSKTLWVEQEVPRPENGCKLERIFEVHAEPHARFARLRSALRDSAS